MARRLSLYQFSQRFFSGGVTPADLQALAEGIGGDAAAAFAASLEAGEAFVQLPPEALEALGFSRRSKRFARAGLPVTREATISQRQALQRQTGERREITTRKHRTGEAPYKTARARENVEKARVARIVRSQMGPDLAPADLKIIVKFRTSGRGYASLTTRAEKRRFRTLFERYSREEILEAIDSPPGRRRGR